MGRIQKKKTSRKKSKQTDIPSSNVSVQESAVADKPAASRAPVKDIKKRQPAVQKKQAGPAKTLPGKGYVDKSVQFLREVKVELKKVTWPTRKQTFGSTAVVIVLVVIISLFLGVVDLGLSNIVRVVLQ